MTLFDDFKEKVMSPTGVIDFAIKKKVVFPNDTAEYVKINFSNLVEELQIDAYRIYLDEERRAGTRAIETNIKKKLDSSSTVDDVLQTIASMFPHLDKFFLSLTQSRRARAGLAFEIILKTLFKKMHYPFEEQQVINGKPDFLMPDRKYFDLNPMDCIIFTAKRSLRERWRQIVTEGTRGLGFYLATIDEKVSDAQLKEMMGHRIYVVVPERIKNEVKIYSKTANVISFETFFTQHLDQAMVRWKANGII